MNQGELRPRIAAAIDREACLRNLRQAIGRASVTGHEANFVGYLRDILTGEVGVRDFAEGRPNIWSVRRGSGGGPCLMLVGHTDTVHVRGWAERWSGDARADPFAAPTIDGAIWGRGAGDLKAGIVAAIEALRTLDRAGLRLRGDVVTAFVGDEESGEAGSGRSAGMLALLPMIEAVELPRADFAIYVEPTTLDIYPAQMGFFIAEIEIVGRSAYFGVPELGLDALKAAHPVLAAMWAHSDRISAGPQHKLVGRAFLLVTGLEAGGYVAVPGKCRLSLIRKLLPSEDLDVARAELEAVVRGAIVDPSIAVHFAYPAARDHVIGGLASETDPALPAVALLREAIGAIRPDRGRIEGAPYWSEASFLTRRLGIPTVYCAPGDIRNCHTFEERVEVDEFLAGVEAFAAFIAAYCGVDPA